MSTWLFVALLFLLPGCKTPPPSPPGPQCAAIPDCEQKQQTVHGLGASLTVQKMMLSPMLIGGKAVDGAEWPASVYTHAGSSSCSATLVGERVLFMAAHCMSNGGGVTFSAHANAYKATCFHHPEYKKNETADWALCLVDRPVTGILFEVLGVNVLVPLNSDLTLSGYGCLKPGGGGGNDGIFRIGIAKVKGLPAGKTYDIVTKGGAALCFGDSGGAAYSVVDKARYVVAINSRGDISTMSYLSGVNSETFFEWAKVWSLSYNNVRLCGIHPDAVSCRNGSPAPQTDGKFEVVSKVGCVRGILSPNFLDKKVDIVQALAKSLEQF